MTESLDHAGKWFAWGLPFGESLIRVADVASGRRETAPHEKRLCRKCFARRSGSAAGRRIQEAAAAQWRRGLLAAQRWGWSRGIGWRSLYNN